MGRVTERRLRDDALAIWKAGVAAVEAGALVRRSLRVAFDSYHTLVVRDVNETVVAQLPLADVPRIAVVGAGKAGTAMVRGVVAALGADILGRTQATGWVNVPDATVEKLSFVRVHGARRLPDNRPTAEGVAGSAKMLEIAKSLGPNDLLLCLISGGGSALLPLPVDGITLEDKIRVTALLQERGATIDEMNAVRKRLSRIKGGRLAASTRARVITLMISDVVGDPIDVIASGPTAADPTTFEDAWQVMEKHGLLGLAPQAVVEHLATGRRRRVVDTPKLQPSRVTNVLIGNNALARQAARETAIAKGYVPVLEGEVTGDTQTAARTYVAGLGAAPRETRRPTCHISGGETTVSLPAGHGKGGRNQEFALAMLDALGPDGLAGVCVLSGGTDGEDGPTDAAGAFVDEDLARAAVAKGLDPADFLRRHDAYNFFDPLGGLVRTGPTNTNVMDLRVVLIDRAEGAAVPALAEPKAKSASARARHV
jgi:hydroxypyruvate reductase/glycerate 2-kinase